MEPDNLVPERPTTSFFSKYGTGAAQAKSAGTALENRQLVGEALSGLSESRLRRRMNQRRETMFDREDQEYAAKKEFQDGRADWLIELSQLQPDAEDFQQQLDSIYATAGDAALKDTATQAILRRKVAMNDEFRSGKEAAVREERMRQRFIQSDIENASNEFVELGGNLDEARDADGNLDRFKLFARLGNLKDQRSAAGSGSSLSRTDIDDQINIAIADKEAFPSYEDELFEEYKESTKTSRPTRKTMAKDPKWSDRLAEAEARDSRKADDYIAIATRPGETEEKFVNWRKGLSKEAQERRREVYRLAQSRVPKKDTPVDPSTVSEAGSAAALAGGGAGATLAQTLTQTPASVSAPEKTDIQWQKLDTRKKDGVSFKWIEGAWRPVKEHQGKKYVGIDSEWRAWTPQ